MNCVTLRNKAGNYVVIRLEIPAGFYRGAAGIVGL